MQSTVEISMITHVRKEKDNWKFHHNTFCIIQGYTCLNDSIFD